LAQFSYLVTVDNECYLSSGIVISMFHVYIALVLVIILL